MSLVAPLFSRRARERRAALASLRRRVPGATVELVLPFPLEAIPEGEHRVPQLLAATVTGVTIHALDGTELSAAPWSTIPPIAVEYAPAPTLMPTMQVGEHRYVGVHGSGTFALSIAQLRRAVRRIERQRPE